MDLSQSVATLIVGLAAAATTAAVAVINSLKDRKDNRENILRDYEIYKNLLVVSQESTTRVGSGDQTDEGVHGEMNGYIRRLMEINSADRLLGLSIEELPSRLVTKGLIYVYPGGIVLTMMLYLVVGAPWEWLIITAGFLLSASAVVFGIWLMLSGASQMRRNRVFHSGAIEKIELMFLDLGVAQSFDLLRTGGGFNLIRKGRLAAKILHVELHGRGHELSDVTAAARWKDALLGSTVSVGVPVSLPPIVLGNGEVALLKLRYCCRSLVNRRKKFCILQIRGSVT